MQIITIIFETLFEIIAAIFRFIFNLLESLFTSKDYGKNDAEFLTDSWSVYNSYNKGIRIGRKAITVKDSLMHTGVFGGSGAGKTATVVLNSILGLSKSSKCSLIIRDPSSELFNKTSAYLQSIGYDIQVLNFSSLNQSTHSFNPLQRANTSGEINRLAETLILGTYGNGKSDPYWTNSAKDFLIMIFMLLKEYPEKYQNLHNARYLIERFSGDNKSLDRLVIKTDNEDLKTLYKGFLGIPLKTAMNTVSTGKNALSIFSDRDLAAITAHDSISFDSIRRNKTAIYLQSSVLDDQYLNVIQSLFFIQLLSSLMEKIPSESDLKTICIVDEASSLTLDSVLETAVSNLRKYGCALCLMYQSENQMERAYGLHQSIAIRSNLYTKVYFGGMDLRTAQHLESYMGKHEVENDKGYTITQPLMNTQHLIQLEKGKAVMLSGNNPPLIVNATPYFKIAKYKRRAQMGGIDIRSKSLKNNPDLLKKIPLTPEFNIDLNNESS